MALPPRAGAVFVLLSEPDTNPFTQRTSGSVFSSYVDMGTPAPYPPRQQSFIASQVWYPDYPDEVVTKVHLGIGGGVANRIYMGGYSGNQSIDSTYPANIVYQYDPTPPPFGPGETPPNPNGTVGTNISATTTPNTNLPGYFYLPRWTDDTAYDITTSGTGEGTVWPKFDSDYLINPNGFQNYFSGPPQAGPWSVDLTVTNLQSEVLNEQTGNYEYYDFTQTSFDFKQTTKVKMFLDANVCCWNKGTVISGTVTFQAIDVIAEPIGSDSNFSALYGFYGMMAKTGSTVTSAGDQSFTVTVESSYVPVEITIPTVSGKITFINDFSVDSVTAPT